MIKFAFIPHQMEQAAQLKAEKVKIALQKIKEANIQKVRNVIRKKEPSD